MPARFAVLTFSEHLGDRESDLPDPVFPFVGDAIRLVDELCEAEERLDQLVTGLRRLLNQAEGR